MIRATLHEMADGREDREVSFQFIEEVQNCPDLWDVADEMLLEDDIQRLFNNNYFTLRS